MLTSIEIQGDGIAACCCARLLAKRGLGVSFERTSRASLPSLLISTSTQRLMSDVFDDTTLFAGVPVINKRVVLWRGQNEPVTLEHSGVVAPEAMLLDRLWRRLPSLPHRQEAPNANDPGWVILSSKKDERSETRHFGSRMALAASVELQAGADPHACWVEAMDEGWLFLLPNSERTGSLIAVGETADALLGKSRLISSQVGPVVGTSQSFAAHPRVLDPLCGEGWLACGTSAMGFDPICGEGAGNAVREAILVSAAVGSIAQDVESGPVLEHYATRLLGGFLKHLHLCRTFYSGERGSEWWEREHDLLEQGITWTQQKLSEMVRPAEGPRFRLVGFDLQPIG